MDFRTSIRGSFPIFHCIHCGSILDVIGVYLRSSATKLVLELIRVYLRFYY